MKIIFLGGFVPTEIINEVKLNTLKSFQSAANNFQYNLINGFKAKEDVYLITAMFVGAFPFYYKKIWIKKKIFKENNINGTIIPFLNLPIIKNSFKYLNIKKELNNIIKKDNYEYIIVYTLNLVYLKAAVDIKKKNKNIKICLIITDLPEYPGDSSKLYKYYLKYFEKSQVNKLLDEVDKFILLAEAMSKKLNIPKNKYLLIEGIYNIPQRTFFTSKYQNLFKNKKTLLYTGSLDFRYGIKELIESFKLIEDNEIKLFICGSGPGLDYVKKSSNIDKRICYLGLLEYEEVKHLQSLATLLVNPRSNRGDYNKYSFPSKTMEYLASATPVIMHKLDCLPNQYHQYLYFFENDDIHSMSKTIEKYINFPLDKLTSDGKRNMDFIYQYKNSNIQLESLINFLKKENDFN